MRVMIVRKRMRKNETICYFHYLSSYKSSQSPVQNSLSLSFHKGIYMNIYTVIIVSALVFEYILEVWADIMNLRHLGRELPSEFRDICDSEAYRSSQEYTRTRTKFGLFTSGVSLLALLIFWFAGGFNVLDQVTRSWGLHPILTGTVFFGILVILRGLLSLPFQIYSTFVIEVRFGFNRTTARTFITDRMKGLLLTVFIGGPFLAGIIAFFLYGGGLAWLWAWLAASVVSIALQFIVPVWIMPLFNKFRPLEDGPLREGILDYARSVKFSLADVFIVDSSKRSSKSNAFFTGFGRTKRIALYDTLVERHTVSEIVAIIAHEVGHYKRNHIIQGMCIGIAHTGALLFLLSLFIQSAGLASAFRVEQVSVWAGMVFFGLLYTPIDLVLSVLMHILSRKNEYQADRFAVDTAPEPEALPNALKKLSVDNLSNLTPHPFYTFLHYSHPPILERVRIIQNLLREKGDSRLETT